MNTAKNVIIDAYEVESYLEKYGISTQILRRIVSEGQMIRNTVTENHPVTAAGTLPYHETVKAKRDALRPLGWTKQTTNNCELTAHPSGNITISVSGGNKETGNQYGNPETKNPKGSQTELLVTANINQPDLFQNDIEFNASNLDEITCQNWVLLYYFDAHKNEVRIELSLPTSIAPNGKINGWKSRLIIDPIQLDPETDDLYQPDYAPDPDIKITRKG